jgi:hypothetical protein
MKKSVFLRKREFFIIISVTGCILCACTSAKALSSAVVTENKELISYSEGDSLTNIPNYDWWYGCSPTAAGMIMGFYDRNGYMGYSYGNLVPGGIAEQNSYPSISGNWEYLCQNVIASTGHMKDFYSGGYGASGDDAAEPFHNFDSLADFMGTSQDSAGNPNGSTTFWNYTNGNPLYYTDLLSFDSSYLNSSGMYGIYEYVNYCGYGIDELYNQYIDAVAANGFTYTQYMAEIDAGRPVLIHLTNHTMFGYGYFTDPDTGELMINVYDTMDQMYSDSQNGQNYGSLSWGGQYQGLDVYGVTVMTLTTIPAPGSIILCCIGICFLSRLRKDHKL